MLIYNHYCVVEINFSPTKKSRHVVVVCLESVTLAFPHVNPNVIFQEFGNQLSVLVVVNL